MTFVIDDVDVGTTIDHDTKVQLNEDHEVINLTDGYKESSAINLTDCDDTIIDKYTGCYEANQVLFRFPFQLTINEIHEATKDLGKEFHNNNGIEICDVTNKCFTTKILLMDYRRLRSGAWLNDSLIEFWWQWISRYAKRGYTKKFHFLSPHFFTTLIDKTNKASVYAAGRFTKERNITRASFICIPINTRNSHWSLLVVVNPCKINSLSCHDECYMMHLDSVRGFHDKVVSNGMDRLLEWLNNEWRIDPVAHYSVDDMFSKNKCKLHSPVGTPLYFFNSLSF